MWEMGGADSVWSEMATKHSGPPITCTQGQHRGGCARRNNYVTCAIISILAHATQFNPLSQHLSVFVRFVPAVTLTCGILAAVRRFSVE